MLELLTSKQELSHENESHHFSCQPSHMLNIFTTLICSLSLLSGNWSLFAFLWTSTSSQSTITYKKNLPVFSHFHLMMLVNNIFITFFFTEEPLAGLNKHELSGKKEMYDAETQTEDLQENGENPLFHSLLQGLEEIVHTRLTQPRWDESPAPGLPVFEPESPDHSSSESGLNELG